MEAAIAHPAQANVHSPDAGRVALTFFFNLIAKRKCTAEAQLYLLGGICRTTCHKYRHLPDVRLPRDTQERTSYLMGIHKSLRILFGHGDAAYEGVGKPNPPAPFNGRSAQEYMLAGRVVDL